MHRGHIQHLGRLVARVGAVIVVVASIGFAAPALAAGPDSPGHSAAGHAHQSAHTSGHHHAGTASQSGSHTGSHSGSQGGSGVSIPKPNDFQAQADPDGMANGGVDQPGGTGGVDTTTQDGNNGSGNDTDCEDDNNGVGVPGHCKHEPVAPAEGTAPAGELVSTPPAGQHDTATVEPALPVPTTSDTQVQAPDLFAPGTGAPASRAAAAARTLPSTGASGALAGLTLAALAALGLGAALVRQGRRARVGG